MLKELFFHIWRDDVGSGWILFTIISFNFCLAFLTFVFCRAKAKNIKFSKKHSIYLIICALIMYQIIPLVLDFYASALYLYKYTQKAIKFEKLAIKTAIIPWQKGCYYLRLSDIYLLDHDYKNELNAQNKAYSYLKTYQAPCWGSKFLIYYTLGKYDIAIEMATDFEDNLKDISEEVANLTSNPYKIRIINKVFEMLGDIINEAIEKFLGHDTVVYFELIREGAKLPEYAHETDAGADVFAPEDITIPAYRLGYKAPTGFKMALAPGWEMQVRPRSGLSYKTSLRVSNAPGTIDEGYRDEVGILFDNFSDQD